MTTALEDARADVAEVLTGLEVEFAGGVKTLKALTAMTENVEPPVFVVVPGQPYISTSGDGLLMGRRRVTWNVAVLVTREATQSVAAAMDGMVLVAMEALEDADYDVLTASQPGTVTYPVSGLKFFGSVITIQHDLKL